MTSEFQNRMKLLSEESTKYMQSLGFEVEQKNGQRHSIYVGCAYNDKDHNNNNNNNQYGHKEREVFIGKIPRDMFEKELYPHLTAAGKIVHLRIMMDFSGTTRGFGFAKYSTPQEAKLAVKLLNGTVIRDGYDPIGVIESFDNKRLYFGNLPPNIDEECLLKELKSILEGVVSVEIPETSTLLESRFAFVQFRTHDDATQARRILVPGDVKMFDRSIKVDWAKPDKSSSFNNSSLIENNNNNLSSRNNNYNFNNNHNHQYQHHQMPFDSHPLSTSASTSPSAINNYDYNYQSRNRKISPSHTQSKAEASIKCQIPTNQRTTSFGGEILGERAKQLLLNCPETTSTTAPPMRQNLPSVHELMSFAQKQINIRQQQKQTLPGASNISLNQNNNNFSNQFQQAGSPFMTMQQQQQQQGAGPLPSVFNLPPNFSKFQQKITVSHLEVMYNLLYSFWLQNNQ